MLARQLGVAALLAFATLARPGSALAAAADAMTHCKSDIARLCPGVQIGGGRIIACLKARQMEMSVGCAKALQKVKQIALEDRLAPRRPGSGPAGKPR